MRCDDGLVGLECRMGHCCALRLNRQSRACQRGEEERPVERHVGSDDRATWTRDFGLPAVRVREYSSMHKPQEIPAATGSQKFGGVWERRRNGSSG
eukprot:scaffold116870_cov36-Tisochrysis_lutea.AAC.2